MENNNIATNRWNNFGILVRNIYISLGKPMHPDVDFYLKEPVENTLHMLRICKTAGLTIDDIAKLVIDKLHVNPDDIKEADIRRLRRFGDYFCLICMVS